ncbi:MAG: acetyl-CoA carboxylase biotin carboxyl carrier protein subunit [Acidobacteria bacterium]|nr:acetyl-CoA carboxylase biotin carboxyl carrier protein subunit [Acidobacteriota bacterium]
METPRSRRGDGKVAPVKLICRMGEETREIEVSREGSDYSVSIDGRAQVVDLATSSGVLHSIKLQNGRQYMFGFHREGTKHEVSFADRTVIVDLFDPLSMKRRRSGDDGDDGSSHVRAIMPGRVSRVHVATGDAVRKGQGLLILEAMKMENEIVAPRDGVVAELLVHAGEAVESGDELVRLE